MMLAFVAFTVLLGLVLGAGSDQEAESVAGRVRDALHSVAASISSADVLKRAPHWDMSRDPDFESEDVPGDDWDNGGWGNGDVSRDVNPDVPDKAHGEKSETWSLGNGDSIEISQLGDEGSVNEEWWGV
ncbi:uncharacterized protein LOC124140282 [Haliotis rufescens]|uniref:uncharacterized protein LOC124140282 n=1 Tax=Haliotis rufescens TaxID=6454 RepID=UPI001EB09DF6|nr:uncharacterized protein LOC124140282 [Haliotis rufescens]